MGEDFPPSGGLPELVNGFVYLVLLLLTLFVLTWLASRLIGGVRSLAASRLPAAVLDTILFAWTPDDYLTLKGLLDGGILVLGRPGSGKSSSSSRLLLKAIADYPRSGGVIIASSTGDLALCREIFAEHPDRLVVFDETSGHFCNALNFILTCGGSTKDVLAGLYAIAESVDRSGGGQAGGEEGSFFSIGARRVIEHSINVIKHATGGVSPADLMAFINGAANSVDEVHTSEFEATPHYQILKAAFNKEKTQAEAYDYENARQFFTVELPRMADRTRTSLIAVVMNTLHIFNSGVNRLLFASETNISPRLVDDSIWILVNMPISRCGQEGAFALAVFKFLTEWYVMRRDAAKDNPPCVVHVDELHRTLNAYESTFLGECRKFGGCMIACSQSTASFYATMGGASAEAQVDALLNNFTHKIIHALGDVKTARWASELIGSAMHAHLGGSEQTPESMLDAWEGKGVWTGTISEQMRPLMEPSAFMHGLRTGGRSNDYLCDAVVIRSGESFASGSNFLFRAFSQK